MNNGDPAISGAGTFTWRTRGRPTGFALGAPPMAALFVLGLVQAVSDPSRALAPLVLAGFALIALISVGFVRRDHGHLFWVPGGEWRATRKGDALVIEPPRGPALLARSGGRLTLVSHYSRSDGVPNLDHLDIECDDEIVFGDISRRTRIREGARPRVGSVLAAAWPDDRRRVRFEREASTDAPWPLPLERDFTAEERAGSEG